MAKPNISIQQESPIKIACNKPFDINISGTVYNPGEVTVCLELSDSLPCSFLDFDGNQTHKICKTVEVLNSKGSFPIDFNNMVIDCKSKDYYTTIIEVSAIDSANEESWSKSIILQIDCH